VLLVDGVRPIDAVGTVDTAIDDCPEEDGSVYVGYPVTVAPLTVAG
jgi:hypothetical protein